MVLKEWKCALHGPFECSHPICPALGCESDDVEREFRTPPGLKSERTKATDAGFRRTAEVYGLSDMSNADGQAVRSHDGGNSAIWGKENVSFEGMMAGAQTPISVNGRTDHNRGLQVAQEGTRAFGGHVVQPAGEYLVHKGDKRGKAKLRIRE